MVQKKRKLSVRDLELSKKTSQKCACLAVLSKRPVIIEILLLWVVCLSVTPQQEIPNTVM